MLAGWGEGRSKKAKGRSDCGQEAAKVEQAQNPRREQSPCTSDFHLSQNAYEHKHDGRFMPDDEGEYDYGSFGLLPFARLGESASLFCLLPSAF